MEIWNVSYKDGLSLPFTGAFLCLKAGGGADPTILAWWSFFSLSHVERDDRGYIALAPPLLLGDGLQESRPPSSETSESPHPLVALQAQAAFKFFFILF